MKGKLIWTTLSLLMVLSLVLAACAPAPVTEEKEEVTPAPREVTPAPREVTPTPAEVTPVAEKPQYGGTLTLGVTAVQLVEQFDQLYSGPRWAPSLTLTNESLLMGDWSRGDAGTGEFQFQDGGFTPGGIFRDIGHLAESWEIPDDQTIIFRIRKGIRYHDKPPVNGRGMDADDVAFSIKYIYLNKERPSNYATLGSPGGNQVTDVYVDPADPWKVVVKMQDLAQVFLEELADKNVPIIAHESIEKYGSLQDWKNALGTGPFILTDYVSGSSMTLVKNPGYWRTDPAGAGKGNRLPYLNGLKFLIMEDTSTQLAALRTGKVAHLPPISWEDKDSLLKTSPEIKSRRALTGIDSVLVEIRGKGYTTYTGAISPLAAPTYENIRVRQALAMAIDFDTIIRDFYKDNSVFMWNFSPSSPYYTKIEDMPEILERVHGFSPEEAKMVEKMYTYHPEEAKKLLADAGYPNGFPTQIIAEPRHVDLMSIVKEYWRKNLNVDVEIKVLESGVMRRIRNSHAQEALSFSDNPRWQFAEKWQNYGPPRTEGMGSLSNINDFTDPVVFDAINRSLDVFNDIEARSKILKETEPYMLYLGLWIPIPAPYEYLAWQPWLKNYYGEWTLGYKGQYKWLAFSWLDQELKEARGH